MAVRIARNLSVQRQAVAALCAAVLFMGSVSCATTKGETPQRPSPPEPVALARARDAPTVKAADQRGLPSETPETVRDAVRRAAAAGRRPAHGTAGALRAIAGMLQHVAGEVSPAEASIDRMLGEIATLEHLAAVDLQRSDRVKAALEDGVQAMRAIAALRQAEWLNGWVEAAEAAVIAIDPWTPLGLQRAVVQDALRSLADAVVIAEHFKKYPTRR